jgi:secreted trypsin-like serine protease
MKNGTWVVVVGVLLLCLSACEALPEAVDLERKGSEIIGGEVYAGLPAVGLITYDDNLHCSGTLIDKRKVLTAAHCVSGFSASKMSFLIGKDLNNVQYTLAVESVKAHLNWDSRALRNDIGLLILAQDAPIAPLRVNTSPMTQSWVGKQLFFVGYGVTNGSTQTGAGTKRAVWMKISTVEDTIFTHSDDPGKNTCNGDSGGPAFYMNEKGEYVVVGITSYGNRGCTQMGADTRVDAFQDFIEAPSVRE